MSEQLAEDAPSSSRKQVIGEVLLLWLVTLLLIRGVKMAVEAFGLPELLLAAVPLLFMYMPVLVCRFRGVDSWDYPLALPSFRDWPTWRQGVTENTTNACGHTSHM